jgi:transcriptional regulator with XRE-family HTH domain
LRYYNLMSLIDTDLLYRTLDAERQARGLSWRDVAAETGLSPSTFSRLPGKQPNLDGYVAMCRWLGMPMETFSKRRVVKVDGSLEPALVELLNRHAVPIPDQQVLLGMAHVYLVNRGISV